MNHKYLDSIPEKKNSRIFESFTLTAIGKIEKHNHCEEKRRNLITYVIKKKGLKAKCYSKLSLRHCLFLQNATILPSFDKTAKHDKQHTAPLNECSAFSVFLWLQFLSFVSDVYFCTSFGVTVACIVEADKCTILNLQIIAEFDFFYLLEIDSSWHHEENFVP